MRNYNTSHKNISLNTLVVRSNYNTFPLFTRSHCSTLTQNTCPITMISRYKYTTSLLDTSLGILSMRYSYNTVPKNICPITTVNRSKYTTFLLNITLTTRFYYANLPQKTSPLREAFKKKNRSKFGFFQTGGEGGYPPTKPIFVFFFKEFSRVNRLIYTLQNMFCI